MTEETRKKHPLHDARGGDKQKDEQARLHQEKRGNRQRSYLEELVLQEVEPIDGTRLERKNHKEMQNPGPRSVSLAARWDDQNPFEKMDLPIFTEAGEVGDRWLNLHPNGSSLRCLPDFPVSTEGSRPSVSYHCISPGHPRVAAGEGGVREDALRN
jgi:hypothetical protein